MADDKPNTPPPPPPPPPPRRELTEDDGPEFGEGSVGGDQPVIGGVADDPDGGQDVTHTFGDGAPPRPVTMSAADLGIDDPDGGDVTDDPDGGGDLAMPADDGGDIVVDLEPVMIIDTYEPFEPDTPVVETEPELIDDTDLETAIDLQEATHTFEAE